LRSRTHVVSCVEAIAVGVVLITCDLGATNVLASRAQKAK
jgi:hypothetical protein